MSRRRLAFGAVVALVLAAGLVAVVALRWPSVQSRFDRIQKGMTYDEVITILGSPRNQWPVPGDTGSWTVAEWFFDGADIVVFFDPSNRVSRGRYEALEPSSLLDRIRGWLGL